MPRLPRKGELDVTKRHACHAECTSTSPSATPATQRAAATTVPTGNRNQARHQSQPSAISATPAMQRDDRCRQVTVDVAKCHACHTNSGRQTGTKRATRASPAHKVIIMSSSATPATESDGRCRQVPRLPCKQRRRPRRQTGTKRANRASPVP